jgi:hypothetical protein
MKNVSAGDWNVLLGLGTLNVGFLTFEIFRESRMIGR